MKLVFLAIGAVAILGFSGYFAAKSGSSDRNTETTDTSPTSNVATVDGVQTVTITARGGYNPRVSTATAGVPTRLVLKTQNTFDCSLGVIIPSLGYRKNLPSTGEDSIDLPPQAPGSTLQGTCSMGMYRFAVNFK